MYFPQLDSIRGLSFIAIFLFHTVKINYDAIYLGDFFKYVYSNLPLAIDVFFILSSFLLTYLALNEYKKRGNFLSNNYFRRRILRIWPLYYSILLLAFVLFPFLANWLHFKMSLPDPLYYIFFVANFYPANHVFFLQFLWTISVEEQFYLLWGFCLRFFKDNLTLISTLLFLISFTFSIYAILNDVKYYFNTLTYLFDFGCGALAALLFFKNSRAISWLSNLPKPATILFYGYLILHFILFYFLNINSEGIINELIALANRYVVIIYVGLLLVEQTINRNRTKFFEKTPFLIFTGKLSYGLYCFHGITITMADVLLKHFNIDLANWILIIIYFTVNYFIACVSYYNLELPFLKLKATWRRI